MAEYCRWVLDLSLPIRTPVAQSGEHPLHPGETVGRGAHDARNTAHYGVLLL